MAVAGRCARRSGTAGSSCSVAVPVPSRNGRRRNPLSSRYGTSMPSFSSGLKSTRITVSNWQHADAHVARLDLRAHQPAALGLDPCADQVCMSPPSGCWMIVGVECSSKTMRAVVDAADLLDAVEAMMQPVPVAGMQELERQVRQVGGAREAEVVLGALARAAAAPDRNRPSRRRSAATASDGPASATVLPLTIDDAAEAEPAGVAGQGDERDLGNDLAILGRPVALSDAPAARSPSRWVMRSSATRLLNCGSYAIRYLSSRSRIASPSLAWCRRCMPRTPNDRIVTSLRFLMESGLYRGEMPFGNSGAAAPRD